MQRGTHTAMSRGMGMALGISLALLCGGAGCTQQRRFQPRVAPEQLSDIQFLHYLETVPLATFGEGCRAMLIAADGSDAYDDHATRYAELLRRELVRDAWALSPDDVLDMGTLCFMAQRVCDLKPSVSALLLGSWGLGDRRYAVRQCADARIIGHAPAYKPVTGGALVWTMGKVDDRLSEAGAYAETPKGESSAHDLLAE